MGIDRRPLLSAEDDALAGNATELGSLVDGSESGSTRFMAALGAPYAAPSSAAIRKLKRFLLLGLAVVTVLVVASALIDKYQLGYYTRYPPQKPSPFTRAQTVDTSIGSIIGLASTLGSSLVAFRGIPYATIPARWQPPTSLASTSLTTRIFNAFETGPCCPQLPAPAGFSSSSSPSSYRQPAAAPIPADAGQAEQCLNLNIFTRSLKVPGAAPVVVFLHGGDGNSGCSAQADPQIYNGTNFVQASPTDVVLVTLNYRLGVMANLFEPTLLEAPGNLDVLDVVAALQWVEKHISAFGGNPDQILLAGAGYGGLLALHTAASNASNGLLQRVLALGPTATVTSGFLNRTQAAANAATLLQALQTPQTCGGASGEAFKSCAQRLSPLTVLETTRQLSQAGEPATRFDVNVVDGLPPPLVDPIQRVFPSLPQAAAYSPYALLQGANTPDLFPACALGAATNASQATAYINAALATWLLPMHYAPQILAAYNIASCASPSDCCQSTEALLLDFALRCPAWRRVGSVGKQARFWFDLSCQPVCPTVSVCTRYAELPYLFATVSSYSANVASVGCAWPTGGSDLSAILIRAVVRLALFLLSCFRHFSLTLPPPLHLPPTPPPTPSPFAKNEFASSSSGGALHAWPARNQIVETALVANVTQASSTTSSSLCTSLWNPILSEVEAQWFGVVGE